MTTSRIFLSGIRAAGRHGANPGEKDRPQEFVVDLDIDLFAEGALSAAFVTTFSQTLQNRGKNAAIELSHAGINNRVSGFPITPGNKQFLPFRAFFPGRRQGGIGSKWA